MEKFMSQTHGFEEMYYRAPDGLRLYYRQYNARATGTPVFCLPGMTRNSRDFRALAENLSGWGRRVICPDLRGRGKSHYDPRQENYHPGTYVQDILKLADDLDFTKIIIIGTSLGGLIAMSIAALRPRLLAGVVLNDIGPQVAAEGLARIRTYVGKAKEESSWQDAALTVKNINKRFFPTYTDDMWMELAHNTYRENDEGLIVADYDPAIAAAFDDDEKAVPAGDPWALMEGLANVPVLLCHGLLSDILTPAIVERMKQLKPDLKVVSLPDTGHVPLLTESECLKALKAWCALTP